METFFMKIKKNKIAAFVLALLVALPGLGWAKGGASSLDFRKGFSAVAAQATPAVVFIQVEKQIPMGGGMPYAFNDPFELFGDDFAQRFFGGSNGRRQQMPNRGGRPRHQQMFKQMGQGSGFLISKDGYILTNTHVVGDVDKITVKLADGREFKAKRIGADPKTEVALIKIDADNLPFLKNGDVQKLETGDWVIAIGNPFGLKETLTVGVVSAKGRSNIGITDYEDFIQTDAAINPGNSGGPLLNIDGEVVGINTAIYSESGGYMGIGFAVPIDMAMSVKSQLVATGHVTRGYIGVMLNPGDVTQEMAKSFGRTEAGGVLVADTAKDGPAEKAGIKSSDIIIELNGTKVKDGASFRRDVARILPNTQADLVVFREGKAKKLTVTVAIFPNEEEQKGVSQENGNTALDKIGFDVQEVTRDLAERFGYETGQGVIISEVDSDSAAEEAGLKPGMLVMEVNRKPVASVKQFEQAVRKVKDGNLLLRIKTEDGTIFLNLKLND